MINVNRESEYIISGYNLSVIRDAVDFLYKGERPTLKNPAVLGGHSCDELREMAKILEAGLFDTLFESTIKSR